MTRGIWQIFTRALGSLENGILMGSFNQSWKRMSLKTTEELSVMTMKNDTKFEEEVTFHFKVGIRGV